MNEQIKDLKVKCNQMASIYNQTYFNSNDARQGFTTVYTPSICYPLATTSISQQTLQNIQKPVISSVLSRMGFNQHMPRAVVFASKYRGGIGLLDLYSEQGASQIKLLITNLRSNTYLHNTIHILLESYQVATGMIGNPLIDLRKHTYVQSPWIQSLRSFLKEINGAIIIPKLNQQHRLRLHDRAIMDIANTSVYKRSQLESINACRLYLQVMTLAEITNDAGDRFLPQVLHNQLHPDGRPKLHDTSKSLLTWPQQNRPSKSAWTLWKRFLLQYNNESGYLTTPLGPWPPTCFSTRLWYYTSNGVTLLNKTTNPHTLYNLITTRSRKIAKYNKDRIAWTDLPNTCWPVNPITITPTYITTTKQSTPVAASHHVPKHSGQYTVRPVLPMSQIVHNTECFFTTNTRGSPVHIDGVVTHHGQVIEYITCQKKLGTPVTKQQPMLGAASL
jgi:hypothetical protein